MALINNKKGLTEAIIVFGIGLLVFVFMWLVVDYFQVEANLLSDDLIDVVNGSDANATLVQEAIGQGAQLMGDANLFKKMAFFVLIGILIIGSIGLALFLRAGQDRR